MSSTMTLYVLTISYHDVIDINGGVDYSTVLDDTIVERWFPHKPTLSEIKEVIPDLNGDVKWIALDEREVEIKKTTLLGIGNPVEIDESQPATTINGAPEYLEDYHLDVKLSEPTMMDPIELRRKADHYAES